MQTQRRKSIYSLQIHTYPFAHCGIHSYTPCFPLQELIKTTQALLIFKKYLFTPQKQNLSRCVYVGLKYKKKYGTWFIHDVRVW